MIRRHASVLKFTESDVEGSFPRKVYFTLRTESDQSTKPDHPVYEPQIFLAGQPPPTRSPTDHCRWSYTSPARWDFNKDFVIGARTAEGAYPKFTVVHAATESQEIRGLSDKLRDCVLQDVGSLDEDFEEVLLGWTPHGAEDRTYNDELGTTDRMSMKAKIECIKSSMIKYVWWEIVGFTRTGS